MEDIKSQLQGSRQRTGFNDGSIVRFPGPENIINGAEDGDGTHDQTAVVHRGRIDLLGRGEEGEEADNQEIDATESVDQRAQDARHSPGAPDEVPGTARQVGVGPVELIKRGDLIGRLDGAGDSSPE